MLIKKIKIFESGDYAQGEFSSERVKNIFSKVGKADAIFSHTSKWQQKSKLPFNIGSVDNFTLTENNGKMQVYADISFNSKGEQYFNDGILNGVSVEITPDDKLKKVGILPIGVNPAISGAEFEKKDILIDFEVVKEESMEKKEEKKQDEKGVESKKGQEEEKKEPVKLTKEEVLSNLTREEIESLKLDGFTIKVEPVSSTSKSEEEIRAEIQKEFEKKESVKDEVMEFMSKNANKITPAMAEVINKDNLIAIFGYENNLEFDKKEINAKEFVKKIFEKIPNFIGEKDKSKEFQAKDTIKKESLQDKIEEARRRTAERYSK